MVSEQSWSNWLQKGLSSAIDGHFDKEVAKAEASGVKTEQVPPSNAQPYTPTAAVNASAKQNSLSVGAISLDKNVLIGTAVVLGLLVVVKKVL